MNTEDKNEKMAYYPSHNSRSVAGFDWTRDALTFWRWETIGKLWPRWLFLNDDVIGIGLWGWLLIWGPKR